MRARLMLFALGLAIASGCDKTDSSNRTADGPRPEPVVVYASYEDEDYLPALFSGFTSETGIRVTMRYADEQENVARVIANRGVPPADVIIAPSIAGMWRAADEGALIPQRSEFVDAAVPDALRDPDNLWTGLGFRAAVIVFDPSAVDGNSLRDYESLADPGLNGKVCLASSRLSVNRSLIAMLIDTLGRRPAELVVRGWIGNLAHPVFDSEAQLIAALGDGTCAVGVISTAAWVAAPRSGLELAVPPQVAVDVEAVGIARHARGPDNAMKLIEWLVGETAQRMHADAAGQYPVNSAVTTPSGMPATAASALSVRQTSAVGRNNEEALLLAARAAYR